MRTEELREMILTQIQVKLQKFVGVKEVVDQKFTEWFQALVAPSEVLPPGTGGDLGGPSGE